MAPARSPQPRPASSTPDADAAAPHAAARPDDVERAWAFLARRTAWERRLTDLRRDAGSVAGAPAPSEYLTERPTAAPALDRPEAA
jgi:hypothetical protein